MAQDSKIEWTHHTDNLWHGCTKVHEGCDHCYAETLSHRWGRDIWGPDKPRLEIKSVWSDLKKQQAMAAAAGEMHRVFVGSMMDIFEKPMPMIDSKGEPVCFDDDPNYPINTGHLRTKLFLQIYEGWYPHLFFLFLTKRPSNINKMIPSGWLDNPPANVMFGTSPCDQATAQTLIPQLLKVKGKRFLSIEPMLGPVDLTDINIDGCSCNVLTGVCDPMPVLRLGQNIDWVICGGESGHGRRPMDLNGARKLRDDCLAAGITFFMKQVDKVIPIPDDLMIRQFPTLK